MTFPRFDMHNYLCLLVCQVPGTRRPDVYHCMYVYVRVPSTRYQTTRRIPLHVRVCTCAKYQVPGTRRIPLHVRVFACAKYQVPGTRRIPLHVRVFACAKYQVPDDQTHTHVCKCVCKCRCVCTCTCAKCQTHTHVSMCVHVYVRVYMCPATRPTSRVGDMPRRTGCASPSWLAGLGQRGHGGSLR
jgi:hypothetical protein